MSCYLPVISTDFSTGIARKLISSNSNGYLFKPGNVDELTSKLRELLLREKEFKIIGNINRKVSLSFNSDKIAKEWFDLLMK